jgi:AGZA family xanthine/uracil permease-like MFS transporter
MRPALQMFMTPVIGVVCFAIILASWFGGVKYFKGVPAGLVAIAVGTVIAWGSNLFGLNYGGMSVARASATRSRTSASRCRCRRSATSSAASSSRRHPGHRDPVRHLRSGRGDGQRRKRRGRGRQLPDHAVLTADGVISLIGCLMGNPFINAVYIGHPGWKAMGGRIGYSAATGIMVLVLTWFGIISVMRR